jgi:hypothetical protein
MREIKAFRAASHQWFADSRLIAEAIDMAGSCPLPSEADRERIHEWIARRHGLTVEEVAALGDLLGGKK